MKLIGQGDDVISRISNYLLLNSSFNENIGFFNGKGAVVLYKYCLSGDLPVDYYGGLAFSFIEEIISQVGRYTPVSYGCGVSGFGALLELLGDQGFLQDDIAEILGESENFILDALRVNGTKDISIVNGVAGLGLYFLFRYNSKYTLRETDRLKYREAVSLSVEQIGRCYQTSVLPVMGIFTGLPGVCLFLLQVAKIDWCESPAKTLLNSILGHCFSHLRRSLFSWEQLECYFVLFRCCRFDGSFLSYQEILASFEKWIAIAATKVGSIPFSDIGFASLWLYFIGNDNNILEANVLSSELRQSLHGSLKENALPRLFPFSESERCVPIGLDRGVCRVALPLISMERGRFEWLPLIGVVN
ncbi:hypothetical protein [Flavihumibacter petaseus]|uniref:Uncharacterized protein n=1 Tax=Flavihumibacter petaseus NBRC 106054 TaxID=1220578 RepID=A0A0E9MW52_9BACT|nr:hypothetical protein [Flavihumibacter petaseus]GAO41952.1 hypothetical protein FPE01S_01_09655 [Flavihumibacter petaseus NBRC 106054]